jgi:hypothetical protein
LAAEGLVMQQLELATDAHLRAPSMADLGWDCSYPNGGKQLPEDCHLVWTHESGARFEMRGSIPLGSGEVRINGGPWEPAVSFDDAVERALAP